MDIHIPLSKGLALKIGMARAIRDTYATARMQRGFLLLNGETELTEEAVGFGVPVLKQGMRTFFPGQAEFQLMQRGPNWKIGGTYTINLIERLSSRGRGTLNSRPLYLAKGLLSELIRRFPPVRGPLTSLSSALRRLFGWETTYEPASASFVVPLTYGIDERAGTLTIDADFKALQHGPITEAIMMHEQGAHHFAQYRDSSGLHLSGSEVGCWDEVHAAEASFDSPSQDVTFSVNNVAGARLFRGRESVSSRLAWSGFGYSMSPAIGRFSSMLKIERLP